MLLKFTVAGNIVLLIKAEELCDSGFASSPLILLTPLILARDSCHPRREDHIISTLITRKKQNKS